MDKFVEMPNLPTGEVSLAVVDGRIESKMEETLLEHGIGLIHTRPMNSTYDAICGHPDIMLHHVGGNLVIVAPDIRDSTVCELERNGFRIIVGEKPVGMKYPDNVSYNAARVGDCLICNTNHTDRTILDMAESRHLSVINIRQGYAKCAICVVGQKAVITSDVGIKRALDKDDSAVDCCLIETGHILLTGMNHGFIGGASGFITNDTISFYGNIRIHPAYEKINAFLSKYGKKTLNLSENTVMDFGTLIPLKEYSIMTK